MSVFKFLSVLFLIPISIAIAAESQKIENKENSIVAPRANPLVYDRTVSREMDVVYKSIFTALENNGYFVLFESNIGKNLSYFEKRWGKDYNTNNLTGIRSMIFCNGSYANQISNLDPSMLALCPLHITFYGKDKSTHILFVRPGKIAEVSTAHAIAKELEDDVIRTIEVAIARL